MRVLPRARWTPAHYLTEENQHLGFVDPPPSRFGPQKLFLEPEKYSIYMDTS
jgi:hypothetical protein